MAHHDDLLVLARYLVDENSMKTVEAPSRRAISTAYYALFHLLIHEATIRLVQVDDIRPRVARTFDHNIMRKVCQEYATATEEEGEQFRLKITGILIPKGLFNIASTFVALQEARIQADYNLLDSLSNADAHLNVERAEAAFEDWQRVETQAVTNGFLSELWCRGIPKRG